MYNSTVRTGESNDMHIENGLVGALADLELASGTYEYRFVVDGKWITDPRCAHTVPNAFGETNSLLIVPKPERETTQRSRNSVVAAVPS